MNKIVSGALVAALLSTVASVPAFAGDLPSAKSAPLAPIVYDSFDPFLIRLRGLAVLPNSSGTTVGGAVLPGLKISDNAIPELDLTYFFTKNWAVELVAGISTHRLQDTAGGIARTTLLPPTLTLQYHFALGQLDPYVGIGANYTWFLDTKSTNNTVNIHSSAGVAFQAGADYYVTKNWLINVDAKYLLLDTTANVGVAGGANAVRLSVNPWIVGGGIGYRFGGSSSAPVVAKY